MGTIAASGVGISYPADVTFAEDSLERSRLTVFFRGILAIPIEIMLYAWGIGFAITTLLAWFAVVFTGKYPAGLYGFGVGYMRMFTNVYAYLHFVIDEYPPWTGNDAKAAAYPVQYSVVYSGQSNRLTVLFRLLLVIPAIIFGAIVGVAAWIGAVIAWFAILITGSYPPAILNFVEGTIRSVMRINSYYYFMTDEYPPLAFRSSNPSATAFAQAWFPRLASPGVSVGVVGVASAPRTFGLSPAQ